METAGCFSACTFICLWFWMMVISVVNLMTFVNNLLSTKITTHNHTHTRTHTHTHLVGILVGVIHDGHQSQPSLLGGGDDLIGGQEEAVMTGVPQLEGVGVLDALVVGPVNGATAGLVYKWNRYYSWYSHMKYPIINIWYLNVQLGCLNRTSTGFQ